jgi:hypothetical protein
MSEITKKSVEQKDAEAEVESFREDLGPFVVAAQTTRMTMLFTDAKEADNPPDMTLTPRISPVRSEPHWSSPPPSPPSALRQK